MGLQDIVKKVRLSLARMPVLGYGNIPEAPVRMLRDLWHGDSVYGMYLVKGELIYQDHVIPLYPGVWANKDTNAGILQKIHGFSWLRDMRELGTENARLTARGLVLDWMGLSASQHCSQSYQPDILANRLVNWLGHYDFFAASADVSFHHYFMRRIFTEGRYIVALLPYYVKKKNHKIFTLLKGAMALSLCMPEQFDLIPRITRYLQDELTQQILEDGIHVERNSEFQVLVLQDLVELRMMYQLINTRFPDELINALDSVSRALRSLRHGDGGLALFNGSCEGDSAFIDAVLSHATLKKVAITDMYNGGYIRCYANRSTLLVDCGKPSSTPETVKHAGALSFEFSVGKQRMIVNCGTGDSSVWASALSGTAAHSVLKLEDRDSVNFSYNYQPTSEINVIASHEVQDSAHWLEMSHDGWKKDFGVTYYRKLYLSSTGLELIGEELIESDRKCSFVIRFHLHPSMMVKEKVIKGKQGEQEKIFLLSFMHKQEGKQEWCFRFSGAEGRIEESVYFGKKIQQETKQIVLYGGDDQDEGDEVSYEYPVLSDEVSEKEMQPVVKTTSGEENSAYVAIVHDQDDNQQVQNQNMQGDFNEKNLEPCLDQEMIKRITEDAEGISSVSVKKKEDKPLIVRWALRQSS